MAENLFQILAHVSGQNDLLKCLFLWCKEDNYRSFRQDRPQKTDKIDMLIKQKLQSGYLLADNSQNHHKINTWHFLTINLAYAEWKITVI